METHNFVERKVFSLAGKWHTLVVFSFSGASWGLTGWGIADVLSSTPAGQGLQSAAGRATDLVTPATLLVFVGLGISLIIQSLIVWAYTEVWTASVRRRPVEFLIGVSASIISGTFAAATVASIFLEADFIQIKRTEATLPVIKIMDQSATQAATWSAAYGALSAEATAIAHQEETVGGTCENEPSAGTSCGPRCRFRQRQASLFNTLADMANTYSDQTAEISLQVQVSSSDAVVSLFSRAKGAERSVETNLITPLRRSISQMQDGFIDPDTGNRYSCRSTSFEKKASDLLDLLSTRQMLPLMAPVWSKPELDDAALGVVLSVWDIVRMRPARVPGIEIFIYFWAFMELLLVLLLRSRQKTVSRYGGSPSEAEVYDDNPIRLTARQLGKRKRVVQTVGRYKVNAGRGRIYLPEPVNGTDTLAAAKIAEATAFFGTSPIREMVDLSQVDPVWWTPRADELGGATHFDLHPLKVNWYAWRRAPLRDISYTEGLGSGHGTVEEPV